MRVAVRKPKRQNKEDSHQITLMNWSRVVRLPDLPNVKPNSRLIDYLFHIPNGGKRGKIEAAIFKKMGTKAGVSDLFLPIPMDGKAGLWIELKAPYNSTTEKNYPTQAQKTWLGLMALAGFKTAVCYGWFEAREVINNYLNLKD